jgi:hypothetical protein
MIHHGQRYLDGSRLAGAEVPVNLEWRNALLERVDVVTKHRLGAAQRHTPRFDGTKPTRRHMIVSRARGHRAARLRNS